ncbi:MAG: 4Fe-4S binding protein [Candidatus Brocadiae bacterium]|nr:4Fe-4S binding protein [Candidatus Brocadiia bacterium]
MTHTPKPQPARIRRPALLAILAALMLGGAMAPAWAAERFPPPEFETGHVLPHVPTPWPRAAWQEVADVVVLLAALSVAAWLALGRRSRRGILWLSIFSLAYFGFYRGGCVCSIGAIQNVALALANTSYAAPLSVVLFFAVPLVFALLFGRVFCGGVCPLGAIQDVVLIRAARVPMGLQHALGLLPWAYLGAAALFAATDTSFIICRYDPFVAFFRMTGALDMLIFGGIVLVLATFVGRPYCRFLCPYGALLGLCARWARKKVDVTPDECVVCSLCEDACPFGAIHAPTPEGADDV